MTLRVLLFDLDNTLVDRDAAMRRYWTDYVAARPEVFGKAAGDAVREIMVQDRHGWTGRPEFFRWLKSRHPGLAGSPDELWDECRRTLGTTVTPYPGVHGMLDALRARFQVGLVTNGPGSVQRSKLEVSGLREAFGAVFISGEVGVEKPHPMIFERALAWAGCAPSEVLFVGDDPERDILGASRAGCRTCWISWGEPREVLAARPDWIVSSIADLPAIL